MKHTITWRTLAAAAALGIMLLLNGCNLTPTDQKPYSLMPSTDSTVTADAVTVTYSYMDTSSVQLSANPVTLKTGRNSCLSLLPVSVTAPALYHRAKGTLAASCARKPTRIRRLMLFLLRSSQVQASCKSSRT